MPEREDAGETAVLDRRKVARFDRLDAQGRIDRTSGAWDHDCNVRPAHCARCGAALAVGEGQAVNTFMADFYRATTGYLCPPCVVFGRTGQSDAS